MGTLRRDSLVWRLLALLGGAFSVTALAVFMLVSGEVDRVVLDSGRKVYAQRLASVMRSLEAQNLRLVRTGQPETYQADFQEAAARNLAQMHYQDDDEAAPEVFPFIVDASGTVVAHPVLAPGELVGDEMVRSLLSGDGDARREFEFTDLSRRTHWCIRDTFAPWDWTVAYCVPTAELMADARMIQRWLAVVWVGVTMLVLAGLTAVLRREIRPLLDLSRAAGAMTAGDLEAEVQTHLPGELGVLSRSFADMRDAVRGQIIALRESETRYRRIFDAMSDGLLLLDQDGGIVAANPQAARTYGWSQEQLASRPLTAILQPRDHELARALRTPPADHPLELSGVTCDREGHLLQTEIGAVRLSFGGVPHSLVILRDVTAQRRLENQLHQSQKLESVGRLAGGIAHDFNNLLTPVLGYSEMLMDDTSLSDDARSDLQAIHRAGERARNLARQLLAFSRRQVLEMRELDLARAAADFEPILRRTLREDIELVLSVEADQCLVQADLSQVEQVIMNLAVNALDAMPDGGRVEIAVGSRFLDRAALEAAQLELPSGDYCYLVVRDTGPGLDDAVLEHAFEPFFTTKEAGKGTGLGLATIHGIAKQHGGAITLRNRPKGGCEAELLLPLATSRGTVTDGEPLPIDDDDPMPRGDGETVVLVEDDDMVRNLVRHLLVKYGYEVRAYPDGVACLEDLVQHPEPAELLLTDVVMPGLNGPELRDRLAALGSTMPVIFMSGYTGDILLRRGLGDTGPDFVQKPIMPGQLLTRIRQTLAGHVSG
jgi:PAS domain S-box-containing protein